jgi:hypothetical protein
LVSPESVEISWSAGFWKRLKKGKENERNGIDKRKKRKI